MILFGDKSVVWYNKPKENDMNYLIKGTSRCGKTMLANMIVKNLKCYDKICVDTMIGTFNSVLPELEINHEGGIGTKTILPKFLKTYISNAKRKDGKLGLYYVMEGVDISNEIQAELSSGGDVKVICLGKASISVDEYFKEVRYYEDRYLYGDWTKSLTDEELRARCIYWINEANEIKAYAEKMGYLFFDTSYNQEKVVKNIFKMIKDGKI